MYIYIYTCMSVNMCRYLDMLHEWHEFLHVALQKRLRLKCLQHLLVGRQAILCLHAHAH